MKMIDIVDRSHYLAEKEKKKTRILLTQPNGKLQKNWELMNIT